MESIKYKFLFVIIGGLFFSGFVFSEAIKYPDLMSDFREDAVSLGVGSRLASKLEFVNKWIPVFESALWDSDFNSGEKKVIADHLASMYLEVEHYEKAIFVYEYLLDKERDLDVISDLYIKLVSIEEIRYQSGEIGKERLLNIYKDGYSVLSSYSGSPISAMSFLVDFSLAQKDVKEVVNREDIYELGKALYAKHSQNLKGRALRTYYESFRTLFYMSFSSRRDWTVESLDNVLDAFLLSAGSNEFGVDTIQYLATCSSEWSGKSYMYYIFLEKHYEYLVSQKSVELLISIADFYSRRGRESASNLIYNKIFNWINEEDLNFQDLGIDLDVANKIKSKIKE